MTGKTTKPSGNHEVVKAQDQTRISLHKEYHHKWSSREVDEKEEEEEEERKVLPDSSAHYLSEYVSRNCRETHPRP